MVTIECMGMGCTPIAWDIESGTKEIVGPDEGHFIKLGDYEEMAGRIITACQAHQAVFSASTRRIRRQFGESVMAANYRSLADRLLTNSPRLSPNGRQISTSIQATSSFFSITAGERPGGNTCFCRKVRPIGISATKSSRLLMTFNHDETLKSVTVT